MEKSLTLYHISDLHFCDKSLKFTQLLSEGGVFSKQMIGWFNYRFRRGKIFQPDLYHQLIDRLLADSWDYLIISGDITNLASRREFENARKRLDPLIKKGPVLFSAGNHDRYTKASIQPDLMAQHFGDCFPFNLQTENRPPINAIELNASTVLFEINLAVPQNTISSKGRVTANLSAYEELIEIRYKNHYKIVVGHFPVVLPENIEEGYLHSLSNAEDMTQFLEKNQINLYLHGHIHKSWHHQPTETSSTIHLNSGGCCRYSEGSYAGFHKIEIEDKRAKIERIILQEASYKNRDK